MITVGKRRMMQGRRYWVENGAIGPQVADPTIQTHQEERKKYSAGDVRLTTGDLGTEIKWHVLSPCFTSLFVIMEWLATAKSPYVLRFYASGWFEEFHDSYIDVVQRLNEIIARGDRHFTCRTLIREFGLDQKALTPLLDDCIAERTTAEDYAVECVYEDISQQFMVERIGPKSAINRVWGTFLSSFPCQSTGSYSQIVSQAYSEVLSTGRPRYDHVLAAMRMPDNEVFWVPYRRLVLPKTGTTQRPAVLVVSEITQVDIQLI
jgi:hypothetical protein